MNRFNQKLSCLLALWLGLSLLFPGLVVAREEITIILTNDIHGDIVAGEAFWVDSDTPPRVGGFPKFATYLQRERQEARENNRHLLYLDGGDFLSGTPESDLLGGRPVITAFNALELDYAVFGNHEIDLGIENLKNRLNELEAEVLASNLHYREKNTVFPGTSRIEVESIGDLKIGFFGLVADYTPQMTLPRLVESLIFEPEVETARRKVKRLQDKDVDLIVGVTHIGLDRDRRLARRVNSVDVITGGHTHDLLWNEEIENNTIIVQAGGRLRNAGRLDLSLETDGEIIGHSWELETLYEEDYPADTGMQRLLEPYLSQVADTLTETVGHTSQAIEDTPGPSTPLGNFITDRMRQRLETELGIINPLGVLDDIPAGKVIRRDLMRAVRFGNHLVELTLTGKQIKEIFRQTMRHPDSRRQLSGAVVKTRPDSPPGRRVEKIYIGGQPLEDKKTYTVATSDYMAARNIFREAKHRRDYPDLILWQILKDYFNKNDTVHPPVENRYRPID